MDRRPDLQSRLGSRSLDVLTALLLGVVSLTTALGAWQSASWTYRADQYNESASDARDASIIRGVATQNDTRNDTEAVLQARKFALLEDEALASGDARANAYYGVLVGNHLARIIADGLTDAFDEWRSAGFPADESPLTDPTYVANLRGDTDAYLLVSQLASGIEKSYEARAMTFAQAALINALSLFLIGVGSINRLRNARIAALVLATVAFLASLFVMAGAY